MLNAAGITTCSKINALVGGLLTALMPLMSLAGPVNLNTADAETIARELTGVGDARAQAIVEYRNTYGEFASKEDLLNVAGIGRYILDSNSDNILIDR